MISTNQTTPTPPDQSWKFRYGVIYLFSFILVGNIIISLGPLIPIKAKAGGQSETDYSIVFTCRGIGYIIGSIVVAKLERKYGSHEMMTITSLVIAAIAFLNMGQTSIILNCIQWWCMGASCSFIEVLTQVSIAFIYVHEDDKINAWMQALHFGFGVGAFIAPLIITFLGDHTMAVFGVVALINAALVYRQTSPKIQKQEEQTDQVKPLKRDTPSLLVKLVCIYFFLDVGYELGYGGWIPTFCTMMGITDEKSAGISSSIFWVAMTVGRLIAIPMASKYKAYDQLRVLSYSNFFITLFCVILMATGHLKILIYLGSAIVGLGFSAVFPLLMTIPGSFGFNLTSDITAIFIVFGSSGEAAVPVFIGLMMKVFGPRVIFIIFLIQSIGMVYLFRKIIEFKPIEEQERKSIEMELIVRR